jgi:hypothetical protein
MENACQVVVKAGTAVVNALDSTATTMSLAGSLLATTPVAVSKSATYFGKVTSFFKSYVVPEHDSHSDDLDILLFGGQPEPKTRDWTLFKIGAGLLFGVGVTCLGYKYLKNSGTIARLKRRALTGVIDRKRDSPRQPSHQVRMAFRDTALPWMSNKVDPTHTHPTSAAKRSATSTFALSLSMKLGLQPYFEQCSPANQRDNFEGSRDYYWAKDVNAVASFSKPHANSLVVVVDVDYYIDMPNKLLEWEGPVLLYTFQPGAASRTGPEYSYTFTDEGEIRYLVSGGAAYQHKVWNYNTDVLMVSNWWTTKVYNVERKKVDEDHQLVFLVPIGTWKWPFSWCAACLEGTKLEYLSPVKDGFCVMDVLSKDSHCRSISRTNSYASAAVPIDVFNALESVARNGSQKIASPTVQSWLDNDRLSSTVVVDYLRTTNRQTTPVVVCPVDDGVRGYQLVTSLDKYEPEAKPIMEAFMSPILDAGFVPHRNVNNEIAAVTHRVVNPGKSTIELLAKNPVNSLYTAAMAWFVDKIVGDEKHKGIPTDLDEVFERQCRPSQRMLLEQSMDMLPNRKLECFIKAEAHQNTKDPRIISTINPVDKREYSRFIYAFTRHIMKFSWCAIGKTPAQIADIVAAIALAAKVGISCADASRMDGRISTRARDLERALLLAYFRPEYHESIIRIHGAMFNLMAYTTLGVAYEQGPARGSGEPATATFNTTTSKFIAFYGAVLEGRTFEEAFDLPSEILGDDITASDVQTENLVKAGAILGQVIENVFYKRGERGVNFLARIFTPLVWSGDVSSCCDLRRTLSKLHLTPNMNGVTPLEKLSQKLAGLVLSDSHTPVIKEILYAARRVGLPMPVSLDLELAGWWAQYGEAGWPNQYDEDFEVVLGIDYKVLDDYLEEIKTPDELLSMPMLLTRAELPAVPAKEIAVVDGDVIPAAPVVVTPQRAVCYAFMAGKCKADPCKYAHGQFCRDFWKGKCSRDNCKFEHVAPPPRK